jgi:hypothetical protein
MQLKLTAMEKRTMERDLRANGVPRHLLAKITAITGEHYQEALDRRNQGLLSRLLGKVTA